jgi:adenosylcobinamide-GDP ribazoletransferase
LYSDSNNCISYIWNPGIVLIGLSIVTALILTLLFRIKLNGVTGDILGAICELNQMLFLLIAYKILTIF